MSEKVYSVVLTESGAQQLQDVLALWLRKNKTGYYVNCKGADNSGMYFVMRLPIELPSGVNDIMEVQIRHDFVKCVLHAEDVKQFGFV